MNCPDCGAAAKSGKVWGGFHFQGNEGAPGPGDPPIRKRRKPYLALEARSAHCTRRPCRWLGIDDTTLTVRRREDKARASPTLTRQSHTGSSGICSDCPDCGQPLEEGVVRGEFHFWFDEPKPSFWRQIFETAWPVKAPAQCCSVCGWIRVQGSRFVIPAFPERGVTIYHE